MHSAILLAMLLFMTADNGAQRGTITGRVSGPDGKPVSGALIMLGEGADSAASDSTGRFAFRNVAAGEYQIFVAKGWFLLPQTVSGIRVESDKTTIVNIRLTSREPDQFEKKYGMPHVIPDSSPRHR